MFNIISGFTKSQQDNGEGVAEKLNASHETNHKSRGGRALDKPYQ